MNRITRTPVVAAALAALAAFAGPSFAVLTPGAGVTVVPLTAYNAAVSGPTNADSSFNQTHLGFDTTGASSFQLTSLTSIGDTVTFSGDFDIDENAADWNSSVSGQGGHRSRLFLQSGVGAPLAAPLSSAQRDDMNQTPGLAMEYNTFGFDDNTNFDYTIDTTNQVTAGNYTFGSNSTADNDLSNGALADSAAKGGIATLLTTIERTGASSFSWTSTIQYRYDDEPSTIIAIASQTGVLALPGAEANTYFTPFNQLGIGDTPGAWSESITNSTLTFDIAAVPEPTTFGLLGVAGLAMLKRRRARAL